MKKNSTMKGALKKLPLLAACILVFGCILWLSFYMRQNKKEPAALQGQMEEMECTSDAECTGVLLESSVPESGTQEEVYAGGLSITVREHGEESGQAVAPEEDAAAQGLAEEIPVDEDYGEPERQDVAPEDDYLYKQWLYEQGVPEQEAGE